MKRLLFLWLVAAVHVPAESREVTATVYDGWYHGRQTACGTRLRIQHQGRILTVPVTDRCDCNSVDLSAGAAHRLGVPLDGIARVTIR